MKLLGPDDDRAERALTRKVVVSILAGSLATLLPVVATVPFLPPFGLLINPEEVDEAFGGDEKG